MGKVRTKTILYETPGDEMLKIRKIISRLRWRTALAPPSSRRATRVARDSRCTSTGPRSQVTNGQTHGQPCGRLVCSCRAIYKHIYISYISYKCTCNRICINVQTLLFTLLLYIIYKRIFFIYIHF